MLIEQVNVVVYFFYAIYNTCIHLSVWCVRLVEEINCVSIRACSQIQTGFVYQYSSVYYEHDEGLNTMYTEYSESELYIV